jgi:hypothetical protein
MKIKFPDNIRGMEAALTLCGQGKDEGNFVGTVPMTLVPKVGLTKNSMKLLKVSSSTSTNKRGVRSGVVKVTIPYEALIADGNGGYVPDPSRSGAELSVHMVIALPATAATDLRSTDDVIKEYARLQIGALGFLLGILMQGFVATPIVSKDGDDVETLAVSPTATLRDGAADLHIPYATSDENAGIVSLGMGYQPTQADYQVNGGIKATFAGQFPAAVGALLDRIARSLPALAGCEDIDVVHYQANEPEL